MRIMQNIFEISTFGLFKNKKMRLIGPKLRPTHHNEGNGS